MAFECGKKQFLFERRVRVYLGREDRRRGIDLSNVPGGGCQLFDAVQKRIERPVLTQKCIDSDSFCARQDFAGSRPGSKCLALCSIRLWRPNAMTAFIGVPAWRTSDEA